MNYQIFVPDVWKDEKPKQQKEIMRDMYMRSLDMRQSLNSTGHYIFTLPKQKAPTKSSKGETLTYFREVTFNSKKDLMGSKFGAYKSTRKKAELGRIRHTKDRKILGMEIIKDHVFGDNLY